VARSIALARLLVRLRLEVDRKIDVGDTAATEGLSASEIGDVLDVGRMPAKAIGEFCGLYFLIGLTS